MHILTVPTTQPCDGCEITTATRGVQVFEITALGNNSRALPTIYLCRACLQEYTTGLAHVTDPT